VGFYVIMSTNPGRGLSSSLEEMGKKALPPNGSVCYATQKATRRASLGAAF
jgi:hypothetical protein